jgi:hypothetical protein
MADMLIEKAFLRFFQTARPQSVVSAILSGQLLPFNAHQLERHQERLARKLSASVQARQATNLPTILSFLFAFGGHL